MKKCFMSSECQHGRFQNEWFYVKKKNMIQIFLNKLYSWPDLECGGHGVERMCPKQL